ncbi:MAG: rhodanese-like domain-containing protein [Acidobacteriota bacterium]
MSIEELSPQEVHERLNTEEGAVYLDVRTEQEFRQGHPAGALNIPIFHLDAYTGQPQPNPEFMQVVEANVSKELPVYVGCASGQRSSQAASILRRDGYQRVVNVDGGFTGKRDHLGNLIAPGWQDLSLPTESDDGGDRAYNALRGKVAAS